MTSVGDIADTENGVVDVTNLSEQSDAAPAATASLLVFPSPGAIGPPESDAEAAGIRHGSPSLFDRLGHLLGLDASIRRWMLVDRLAALIGFGIPASDALDRLHDAAANDAERDMIGRAIAQRDTGAGLADALSAAGGYPAQGLAAVRAAPAPADEAAALADLAAILRRRLTLRYSAALGGAALTAVLAVALLQHRPVAAPPPSEIAPSTPSKIIAEPAPAAALPQADLAPALGPGIAGAPPALVGIVGRLPDDAVALIRMPSGRTRMLPIGAVFDGWTLASLDAEEAVFSRQGQRVTVALPPAEGQ